VPFGAAGADCSAPTAMQTPGVPRSRPIPRLAGVAITLTCRRRHRLRAERVSLDTSENALSRACAGPRRLMESSFAWFAAADSRDVFRAIRANATPTSTRRRSPSDRPLDPASASHAWQTCTSATAQERAPRTWRTRRPGWTSTRRPPARNPSSPALLHSWEAAVTLRLPRSHASEQPRSRPTCRRPRYRYRLVASVS
jgi:hypothetical protein